MSLKDFKPQVLRFDCFSSFSFSFVLFVKRFELIAIANIGDAPTINRQRSRDTDIASRILCQDASFPRIISFRNELRNIAGVQSVAGSSSVPGNYSRSFSLFLAEGKMDVTQDWQVAVVDHVRRFDRDFRQTNTKEDYLSFWRWF